MIDDLADVDFAMLDLPGRAPHPNTPKVRVLEGPSPELWDPEAERDRRADRWQRAGLRAFGAPLWPPVFEPTPPPAAADPSASRGE
jgi:hypothetical protein